MNRYLCIVAAQRAGTTALHSALAETGRFYNFREIFHTDPAESPGTFLKFLEQRELRVADMATDAQAQRVALEYLAYLRDMSKGRVPILDIKLNSWNALKPFWGYVHETPFFMRTLLGEEALFLFVRRRELADQVISELIARSVDKWHNLEEHDVKNQLVVDTALVARQARLILQGENFLLSCLGSGAPMVAIDYEDLFPDGLVNGRLLQTLRSRLGIELPVTLTPSIRKNQPDKRRIISNYDEACDAVAVMLKRYPRALIANQLVA